MDRLNEFIRVCATPGLWYNFDTRETINDEELRARVANGTLSDDDVSSVPDVFPLFGDLETMINLWIPYTELLSRPEGSNTFPAEIRIAKQGRGVKYPVVKGFIQIPAFSRGKAPWKDLSPFTLGPVIFEEDGEVIEAANLENYWHAWKAWKKVGNEIHIDAKGNPNKAWKKWHRQLLATKEAIRRPNSKAVPEYAWWQGEKLGIVEARKKIYIPAYQALIRAHPTYQLLLKMVKKGQNIIIIEPDGPTTHLWPDGLPVTLDLLYDLQSITSVGRLAEIVPPETDIEVEDRYMPYGHSSVIALTLFQDMLPKL